MRRCTMTIPLVALVFAQTVSAQWIKVIWPKPDYNMSRRAYDGGITMPRYGWNIFNFGLQTGLAIAISKITHTSPMKAVVMSTLSLNVGLHSVQVARGKYPLNAPDWISGAWIGLGNAVLIKGREDWREAIVPGAAWAFGYTIARGYTSP